MFKNEKLDIIVPCLNEERNLFDFYEIVKKVIKKIDIQFSIIFIDDGSVDKTWEIIKNFANQDKNVVAVKLSKNFGHQAALKAGLDFANGNYIFSLDADLQDPPELLNEMLIKMKNESLNVVYAQRNKNKENFFKKISSRFFYYFFNKISRIHILPQVSDFRLIDRKVLNELKKLGECQLFLRGIIPWMGFKFGIVNFEREKRTKGETGWSLIKMIDFALLGIFNFSNLPMRLSFFITFFMIIIFLIFALYAMYSYTMGDVVRGWTSLVIIISFFNMMVFFILGLLSEYLGRIYHEVKKRPTYIIDEKIN